MAKKKKKKTAPKKKSAPKKKAAKKKKPARKPAKKKAAKKKTAKKKPAKRAAASRSAPKLVSKPTIVKSNGNLPGIIGAGAAGAALGGAAATYGDDEE